MVFGGSGDVGVGRKHEGRASIVFLGDGRIGDVGHGCFVDGEHDAIQCGAHDMFVRRNIGRCGVLILLVHPGSRARGSVFVVVVVALEEAARGGFLVEGHVEFCGILVAGVLFAQQIERGASPAQQEHQVVECVQVDDQVRILARVDDGEGLWQHVGQAPDAVDVSLGFAEVAEVETHELIGQWRQFHQSALHAVQDGQLGRQFGKHDDVAETAVEG